MADLIVVLAQQGPPQVPDGYISVHGWLAWTILGAVGTAITALALALRAMWSRGMTEKDEDAKEAKALVREMVGVTKDLTTALTLLTGKVEALIDEHKRRNP